MVEYTGVVISTGNCIPIKFYWKIQVCCFANVSKGVGCTGVFISTKIVHFYQPLFKITDLGPCKCF